jgi:hypothetical protein
LQAYVPSFLAPDWFKGLKNMFDKPRKLNLLYNGSMNEFSADAFHESCDDKGATLTVCKSEHNFVFGIFTTVPWQRNDNWVTNTGESFVFRQVDVRKIVKAYLKSDKSEAILHSPSRLPSFDSFQLYDKAD